MTDPFQSWDAAYVLGALSDIDRAAYEDHLHGCGNCADAVAELADLPDVLRAVDPVTGAVGEQAGTPAPDAPVPARPVPAIPGPRTPFAARRRATTSDRDEVPDRLRVRLLAQIRRERRRTRAIVWGSVTVAAASLVALTVVLTAGATSPPPQPQAAALSPLLTVPLRASLTLTDKAWGTEVHLRCSYDGSDSPGSSANRREYALVVQSAADGTWQRIGEWSASPGVTASLDAPTSLARGQISTVEIRSDQNTPLLRLTR